MTYPRHRNAPEANRGESDSYMGGAVESILQADTDTHHEDTPRCLACHRPLTRPESVTRGFGPHCHTRLRSLTVAILAAGGSVVVP